LLSIITLSETLTPVMPTLNVSNGAIIGKGSVLFESIT
jgi:hypothetical protein